nr:hypothetical protein [Streptomyces sp. RFCAC02]
MERKATPAQAAAPHVGALAQDTRRGKVGQVVEREESRVCLRPPGGGPKWDARPEDVRPLTRAEHLSARVAEVNARSRRGRG